MATTLYPDNVFPSESFLPESYPPQTLLLHISHHLAFRLYYIARHRNLTVEDAICHILEESINTRSNVYIYALIDPRTRKIRYIGQTMRSVDIRIREFITTCSYNKKTHATHRWIRELKLNGLKPAYKILDVGDELTSDALEEFYIASFRMAGFELTNETSGGHGYRGKRPPRSKSL